MKNLRIIRKKNGITMKELGEKLDLAESTISQYETGKRQPDNTTLMRIAEFFGVTTDFLLGKTSDAALNIKDERDIAKKLDSILAEMNSQDAMMFDGEEIEMDEESKELLRISLENSLRLAKKLAKKKYTPKKYKSGESHGDK